LLGLVTEAVGIQYLGYMYASLMLLSVLSTYYVKDSKVKPIPVTGESLKRFFKNRSFLWFLVLVLMIATAQRMNEGMLALYLIQLGGTESHIGKAWMLATFSAVPAMALMGSLLRRYHELILFILASFFFALRWGINSFAEDPVILIYSQLLHFATFPIFFVSSIHFIYKIVPEELRVTGQAILAAVYGGLGGIIGIGGGGWIMDHYGPQTLYQIGSLLCLTAGVAAIITYFYQYSNEEISPKV
jgi:PPP family 3-phenylpropionic acid transporter